MAKRKPRANESQADAGGGSEETMPRYVGANGMPDVRGHSGKQWYDYPDPYKPRKPVRPPVIITYTPPGVPQFPKKVPKKKKPGFGGASSEDQGFL